MLQASLFASLTDTPITNVKNKSYMSSKIEWTEDTWNPLIGCDKISAGCKNCYAIKTAWIRMHNPAMKEKYAGTVEKTAGGRLNWTGKVNIHQPDLVKPLKAKKPTVYFVNSMSDLFHEAVPFTFIDQVFAVMALTPQHTYQILTKRADRMAEYFKSREDAEQMEEAACEIATDNAELLHVLERAKIQGQWETFLTSKILPHVKEAGWLWDTWTDGEGNKDSDFIYEGAWPLPNVWLGVSVEDQKAADERIPYLLQTPAAVRFLSCEPLLGPVDLGLYGTAPKDWGIGYKAYYQLLHWVIVGGESGSGARPMHPDWARSLRDQCAAADVSFFFKQWGEWRYHPQTDMYELNNNVGKSPYQFRYYDENLNKVGIFNGPWIKCGKKAAGRLLDGQLHDAYPLSCAPTVKES